MKRCPRCFTGQMWGELVHRAARPQQGQRLTCLACGEADEVFPPLAAVNLAVKRGRPPKVRAK